MQSHSGGPGQSQSPDSKMYLPSQGYKCAHEEHNTQESIKQAAPTLFWI